MKTVVVLPTYNENGTIEEMVRRIFDVRGDGDIGVIVVDDNSPDGTGEIADRLVKLYPGLEVMHRFEKRGRGSAGIAGFKRALEKGADYIIEMDADLSHDPAYIPSLIGAMSDSDLAIGSRYIKGGGDPERGIIRRPISLLANLYIRVVMGIPGVKDCTSGFRCFKRELLESINLDGLRSTGPSIVTEILYKCRKAKIREVPITFKERGTGRSKFNLKAMVDSLYLVLLLRLEEIFSKK